MSRYLNFLTRTPWRFQPLRSYPKRSFSVKSSLKLQSLNLNSLNLNSLKSSVLKCLSPIITRTGKLTLVQKSALALGSISFTSGITLGSMLLYAANSDEVLGIYSSIDKSLFRNNYSAIRNAQGQLIPVVSIVDPLKKNTVGQMSDDGRQYWFTDNPGKRMNFQEFFDEYFKIHQEPFIQQIRYGSFKFFNEYVLAVRPHVFLEFTKWFIDNVAWGPDLLTLDSFRIVPGVEKNGNAIILGSHASVHKETNEIKFFPDAFFGTSPIYSINGGPGNAKDALTETVFKSPVKKYQLDGFLTNLTQATVLKNAKSSLKYKDYELASFKNVYYVNKLVGHKVKVFVDEGEFTPDQQSGGGGRGTTQSPKKYKDAYKELYTKVQGEQSKPQGITNDSVIDQSTKLHGALNLVFRSDISEQEYKSKIDQFISERPAMNDTYEKLKDKYNSLEEYTIKAARALNSATSTNKANALLLDLEPSSQTTTRAPAKPGTSSTTESISIPFYDTQSTPSQYYAEVLFEDLVRSSIKNFLDFYDMDAYIGQSVYLYKSGSHKKYYPNAIVPMEQEEKFSDNNLTEYTVKKFSVSNKTLSVDLEKKTTTSNSGKGSSTTETIQETFQANQTDKNPALFRSFKYAVGYKGAIVPRTITATPESVSEKDKKGNVLKGLDARRYQVYADVYNGLLDEIAEKFPFLMKKQSGPHLVKSIDANGVYQYKLAEGEYRAFSVDDNIGIPLMLATVNKNYQGVSTDFLRYVAAHEYGHHYTLEKFQSIDEDDSAVLVGGLSTRGGPSDASFFSFKALKNYLHARTTLDVRRVDVLGNPNDKSPLTQFGYIKKKDTTQNATGSSPNPTQSTRAVSNTPSPSDEILWESHSDIWGDKKSADKSDIWSSISNPNRRFINTFEGLNRYAKDKNIALGDIFIANSFDIESGTLNPFTEGNTSVLLKKKSNSKDSAKRTKRSTDPKDSSVDEKEEYGLHTITQLLDQLTDGQGNPIQYEKTPDRKIRIKFVKWEGEDDDKSKGSQGTQGSSGTPGKTKSRKIKEFLIKDANGNPIIKAPTNRELTQKEELYILRKIDRYSQNILSLYGSETENPGWNTSTSRVGDMGIGFGSLYDNVKPKSFFDSILYRNGDPFKTDDQTSSTPAPKGKGKTQSQPLDPEFDPKYNGIPWKDNGENASRHVNKNRKSNLYYVIDESDSNDEVLRKIRESQLKKENEGGNDNYSGYWSMFFYSNKALSFVSNGSGSGKNGGEKKIDNYVFPVGVGLSNNSPTQWLGGREAQNFDTYLQRRRKPRSDAHYQRSSSSILFTGFGLSEETGGKSVNSNFNFWFFSGLDSSNKVITSYTDPATTSGTPSRKTRAANAASGQSSQISKFGFSVFSSTLKNHIIFSQIQKSKSSILSGSNQLSDVKLEEVIATTSVNGNTAPKLESVSGLPPAIPSRAQQSTSSQQIPTFTKLKDLVEFGSIDYSKATKDTSSSSTNQEKYNWDVCYVMTKFDLTKVKSKLKKNSTTTHDCSKPQTQGQTPDADCQEAANEIMKWFVQSPYFFTVKEFKVKDLEKNEAIFSKDYGINFNSRDFKTDYLWHTDQTQTKQQSTNKKTSTKFDVNTLKENLKNSLKNWFEKHHDDLDGKYPANAADKAWENMSVQDLLFILGNLIYVESDDDELYFSKMVYGQFSSGKPTNDSQTYYYTRNESQLGDKFTDYVYSLPETLTRDFVQTTFTPNRSDFGNLPSYVKSASEANTGLDYVNDVSALGIWLDRMHNKSNMATSVVISNQVGLNPPEYYKKRAQKMWEWSDKINKKVDEIVVLLQKQTQAAQQQPSKPATGKQQQDPELKKQLDEYSELVKDKYADIATLDIEYSFDIFNSNTNSETEVSSSWFGKLSARNNGFFKDKWEKETIGMHLYDPVTGDAVTDNSIRLKDTNGQLITSRPRAFFYSQIYNYGVGDRTVSGIFRNKSYDALALYGFVKNTDAAKISKLKFTNTVTGEVKLLEVNIEKTNNIFYLEKHGDPSSKKTLEQEGWSSWISDYALMGKYRDALLFPGNSFSIDFVDSNGNTVTDANGKSLFSLGKSGTLTENGKHPDNAPVSIRKHGDKPVIYVDKQFNVI